MTKHSREHLARSFRHFAEICAESSPLYAELSGRVAAEEDLLVMAACGQPRQPPPNLLFGAVHHLLLGGAAHPLRSFYPSLGGSRDAAEAWPEFVGFCRAHRDVIVKEIAARRVQTNEVGRCGLLVPAIALAQRRAPKPLHLVEVGASAGLNLLLDRFRCEYSYGASIGDASRVIIRVEVRGEHPVTCPEARLDVVSRVGIDIAPVDVMDADAVRWIEALIWPEHVDRLELQRQARSLAQLDPPRVIEGDGLELVAALMREIDADALPCVFHSHAIYQMTDAWRGAFRDRLDTIGRKRDLAHVSLEWLKDDPGPQLHLTTWQRGTRRTMHLAECHHHGRWIRPLGAWTQGSAVSGSFDRRVDA